MITNVAGEEAESPADPNSDLGRMSKKVCFIYFIIKVFMILSIPVSIPINLNSIFNFDCKEMLTEHVINI